jgi:hypothetical protein
MVITFYLARGDPHRRGPFPLGIVVPALSSIKPGRFVVFFTSFFSASQAVAFPAASR